MLFVNSYHKYKVDINYNIEEGETLIENLIIPAKRPGSCFQFKKLI